MSDKKIVGYTLEEVYCKECFEELQEGQIDVLVNDEGMSHENAERVVAEQLEGYGSVLYQCTESDWLPRCYTCDKWIDIELIEDEKV